MNDVLVLCYHAVSPVWDADLSVRPEILERQLTYLASHGWRGATFRDAVSRPAAAKTVAITFDDAFVSVKELALPILSHLGFTATVFAPTTYVSGRQPLNWQGLDGWEKTPYADELQAMSWNDLGCLLERGWEIGSHTRTHPRLTQLDDRRLVDELEGSRAECLHHLGSICDTIAYPYGDVDERVVASAARAGYVAGAGLSSELRRRGPHWWPRVGVYHNDASWRFRLKTARSMRRLRASALWPDRA